MNLAQINSTPLSYEFIMEIQHHMTIPQLKENIETMIYDLPNTYKNGHTIQCFHSIICLLRFYTALLFHSIYIREEPLDMYIFDRVYTAILDFDIKTSGFRMEYLDIQNRNLAYTSVYSVNAQVEGLLDEISRRIPFDFQMRLNVLKDILMRFKLMTNAEIDPEVVELQPIQNQEVDVSIDDEINTDDTYDSEDEEYDSY